MTGDGEATAYIHDRWCFAGWQVMVLGTGGERPKDALLRRGTYFTARTDILGTGRCGGKGSVVGEKQKRSWGTSQFLLATGEACASAFWF